MNNSYILAIDQGTSSTKTIVFDAEGKAAARASEPLKTFFKDDGFVEQDPEDIYQNVLASVEKCLSEFEAKRFSIDDIKACGLSNQRETFVLWDEAGKPLHNAVVWQCKRSVSVCERLKKEGLQSLLQSKTGLLIDPYFSGSKVVWLYENNAVVKQAIDDGKAYFGTVDSWLLFKLTGGKNYLTDYTNASRTLFFNLNDLAWDKELLDGFGLSNLNLPKPQPSSSSFGYTDFNGLLNQPVAITAMIGDSHSAAFGEGCFTAGTAKATLGTGCSILMNTGAEPKASDSGMVTTVCWSTEDRVDYALEGVIVSCGATVEWLKNDLGLFADSRQTEKMANEVADNNGVYLVPAFSGLGAPHWDMKRKASISGLTFGCNKNHIVRAALESIPYQIKDVLTAMEADADIELQQLMVDGGITSNSFVLRFLADLLGKTVARIGMPDVSALGAAYLAGLKAGVYKDLEHLKTLNSDKVFVQPNDNEKIKEWYAGWQKTIGSYSQQESALQGC
ncbi:FGGY family carbohydrate kinase [Flavisolibacter ginsenosidimutans]|uniref:ATP:glycerol 3-phosphotransferase n=1 Tax=Flavisolibacter ginsenosidimutans TaxID=661481 RepID=A0A5B8UJ36_9BACT|nr:glycerol kinase GlpK [Flavisolibacter ginsenosidimutans]QEC56169.1 glycerol kinase GlpK [Flavisolibacter ginsenosidimutans]